MLVLQSLPPGFGQPSLSPFCVKAMALLNMSGSAWRVEFLDDPRKAPMGKLPVLLDGNAVIADSTAIGLHLEKKTGRDFDEGLSAAERAACHMATVMAEEHLYWHLIADRWASEKGWPATREAAFGEMPAIMRMIAPQIVRGALLKALNGQGVGRYDDALRMVRAEADLLAISTLLAEKPFLSGDVPGKADASVGALLNAILAATYDSPLAALARAAPGLEAYAGRVRAALFPESGAPSAA